MVHTDILLNKHNFLSRPYQRKCNIIVGVKEVSVEVEKNDKSKVQVMNTISLGLDNQSYMNTEL